MKLRLKFITLLAVSFLASGYSQESQNLINGKNLKSWYCIPEEQSSHWTLKEGEILHGENPDQQGSILWTEREYRNFELELEYRTLSDDYDTGVFLRGESHQVQIGISRSLQKDMTGCVYAPEDQKGAYPGQTDKVADFHWPGDWNHLLIIVQGKRIKTFLNIEPFVDYEGITINEEGPIGLQLHQGVHMVVEFKNIRITEL